MEVIVMSSGNENIPGELQKKFIQRELGFEVSSNYMDVATCSLNGNVAMFTSKDGAPEEWPKTWTAAFVHQQWRLWGTTTIDNDGTQCHQPIGKPYLSFRDAMFAKFSIWQVKHEANRWQTIQHIKLGGVTIASANSDLPVPISVIEEWV